MFIWRKVGPARRVTLPSQKGDWVGESSFQPSQSLVSYVKTRPVIKVGSPRVARGLRDKPSTQDNFSSYNGALQ